MSPTFTEPALLTSLKCPLTWPTIALAVLSLTSGVPAQAAPATYRIDPTHTAVSWEVLHMGTSTSRVRFDAITGHIRFDKDAPAIDLDITVDTASLNSGHAAFDQVLRGASLFATEAHPQAIFVARGLQMDGGSVREVRGELTLKGINRPLTLRATRWKCGLNLLFKREVCGGDFEAQVKRSDFGMTFGLPLVGDDIHIVVQVEAIKEDGVPGN